jgi:YNFM family putative membrane transporter
MSAARLHSAAPTPAPTSAFPATTGAVALLVTMALLVLTQLYAAIPLIGPVGDALGGDATLALSTVFSLCYAIGFVLWGPISDHYGRKRILIVGIAALTLTTLGCVFASSLTGLAVLRAAQGLAAASFAPAALAYLSEAVAPARRPVALGAISTAFLVAGIVGQVLAATITLLVGWTWFFVVGAAALGLSLVGLVTLPKEAGRPAGPGGLGQRFAAFARVVSRPPALLLSAAHVTLLLSFVAMYTALGPHLVELGLAASQVIWLRLVGLPGMFTALLVGVIARRLGYPGAARLGYLLAAVGITGEALFASTLVGIAVTSLVFVTGVAITIPAMITLFGETAAPNRAGGMALTGLVLFIGASIGPVVASVGWSFPALMLVLATLLVSAAGFLTAFARVTSRAAA